MCQTSAKSKIYVITYQVCIIWFPTISINNRSDARNTNASLIKEVEYGINLYIEKVLSFLKFSLYNVK